MGKPTKEMGRSPCRYARFQTLQSLFSRYRRRYLEYLVYQNRAFDVKGLSTQGPYSWWSLKTFMFNRGRTHSTARLLQGTLCKAYLTIYARAATHLAVHYGQERQGEQLCDLRRARDRQDYFTEAYGHPTGGAKTSPPYGWVLQIFYPFSFFCASTEKLSIPILPHCLQILSGGNSRSATGSSAAQGLA